MALRATSDNENLRRSGSPERLRGTSFPTYNVFSSNEDSSTYRHFRDKLAKSFPALVRRGCPRIARAGAVCSKTKVPINKRSASGVYSGFATLNRPPRRFAAPLLTKEGTRAEPHLLPSTSCQTPSISDAILAQQSAPFCCILAQRIKSGHESEAVL
jgi:hypothetical protein